MNRTARIAVHLTILGLIADLAYVLAHAAVFFLLDGMWLESVAYLAVGSTTIAWISTTGASRTRALLSEDSHTSTDQGE
ncbi:hypothetical protein ACIBG4_40590 [Nonomuraea sp. NPDC050383]|uniref:hypothetical protein n=1 Tax=Nonomuraea sp. NPDC050383 TaxID=3364362 RepID=UPI0037A17EBC